MSSDGRVVISRKPWLQSANGIRNTQAIYQGPHVLSRVPPDYAPRGNPTARLLHAGGINSVGYDSKRMSLSNAAGTQSVKETSPCGAEENNAKFPVMMPDGTTIYVSCDIENPTIPSQYEPGTGTQQELETTYIEATHLADQFQNAGGNFSQASGVINNWAHMMDCLMLSIGAIEKPTANPPIITNPQPACKTQPATCSTNYANYGVTNTSTDTNCNTCVDTGCLTGLETQASTFQKMLNEMLSTTAIDFNSAAVSNPKVLTPPLTAQKIRAFLTENPNMIDQIAILGADADGLGTNLTTLLQMVDSLFIEWVANTSYSMVNEFIQGFVINQTGSSIGGPLSANDWLMSLGYSTGDGETFMLDVRKNMWNIIYSSPSYASSPNTLQSDFNTWLGGFVNSSLNPWPTCSYGTGANAIIPSLYQTADPTTGDWNPMGTRWLYLAFKALQMIGIMFADAQYITNTNTPSWVLTNKEFNSTDIASIPSAWTQGIWNGSAVCFPSAGTCDSDTFYYNNQVQKIPWAPLQPHGSEMPLTPLKPTPQTKGKYILWGGVALVIGYSIFARYGFANVTA